MTSCAFKKCKNNTRNTCKDKGITFHLFPNEPRIRQKWIKRLQDDHQDEYWLPTKFTKVCSTHFTECDYYKTPKGRRKMIISAVPTFQMSAANYAGIPLSEAKRLKSEEENVEACPATATKTEELLNENVFKVLCFKCKTEVEPTEPVLEPTTILEGQIKAVIAKVYHFLEKEYEQMKKMFGELDLTPLMKFRQRTADATGFSESTVAKILKEEKEWYSTQIEPPEKRCRSDEDTSDEMDRHDAGPDAEMVVMEVEATNIVRLEPPVADLETLIVKEEVSDDELYETDNIGIPSGAGPTEDTIKKEPDEVTLHEPTACGNVIKTELEDDDYPVPPARGEASIAEDMIKVEPDDDESSGSSSVEDETGLHIEKIEFTAEEFR